MLYEWKKAKYEYNLKNVTTSKVFVLIYEVNNSRRGKWEDSSPMLWAYSWTDTYLLRWTTGNIELNVMGRQVQL